MIRKVQLSLKNFFFQLGFTPCKAEQPLQEKKHKKITGYRKSV